MTEWREGREDFPPRAPTGLDLPRGGTEYPPSGAQGVLPPMEEVVRNQIREFLAGKGLRKTSQRDAIIEAAFSTDRHYTADELLDMARGIERTVSRATVYRTLPILVESGLLRELDLGQGRKVYDPNFVDHPHHNHLICLDCHNILEFEDLNMELLENCMAKRMGFTPANKQVRIEARCDELKINGVCRKSGREVFAAAV
jgi:Fur family ferric uptake transcriptional regulator